MSRIVPYNLPLYSVEKKKRKIEKESNVNETTNIKEEKGYSEPKPYEEVSVNKLLLPEINNMILYYLDMESAIKYQMFTTNKNEKSLQQLEKRLSKKIEEYFESFKIKEYFRHILEFVVTTKSWIAGSFLLKLIIDDKSWQSGDIDIFTNDKLSSNPVMKKLTNMAIECGSQIHQIDNHQDIHMYKNTSTLEDMKCMNKKGKPLIEDIVNIETADYKTKFQFIQLQSDINVYSYIQDSFDFDICKIAFTILGTNKIKVSIPSCDILEQMINRKTYYHKNLNIGTSTPEKMRNRIKKYIGRQFKIDVAMADIINYYTQIKCHVVLQNQMNKAISEHNSEKIGYDASYYYFTYCKLKFDSDNYYLYGSEFIFILQKKTDIYYKN